MTAVQHVFRELEKQYPELFDIQTSKGRDFVNNFNKFLDIEESQFRSLIEIGYYCRAQSFKKSDELLDFYVKDFKSK